MKKYLTFAVVALALAACGSNESNTEIDKEIEENNREIDSIQNLRKQNKADFEKSLDSLSK